MINGKEAKRDPADFRFDLLDWEFIYSLALLAKFGADKYGELDWQKSRLSGDKSPMNHIIRHFFSYKADEAYNHGDLTDPKYHLVAIAFNAMMEFWYETHK